MNPETIQNILWTLIGGTGLAVLALQHRWNRADAKALREWRQKELRRRIDARSVPPTDKL
jgi:hypothetical protein